MEWLYGIVVTAIISLQVWILLEIVALKIKVAGYDAQLGRLVSDAESEKGTRKRVNDDIERRLRALEHHHT